MSNKRFAERLNKALDEIGVPERRDERIEVFAKLLKIPRFKADALLSGALPLDSTIISLLTTELEVSKQWLMGEEA